jgi:hypothetical protein
MIPGGGQPGGQGLASGEIKAGLTRKFCGWEKKSGTAPAMILKPARGGELGVGWIIA